MRSPLGTPAALQDWFDGTTSASSARAVLANSPTSAVLSGASGDTTVSVPANRLHFGSTGVYAIAVSVVVDGTTIGSARTAVAWKTTGSQSVPVAIAAPLTVPASASTFISSADLATYTSPTGVLTKELAALENTQVAIGIDPRILASIRILGKSAPQSARDWLTELEGVSNGTFPLAWADADLTVALQGGAATVPVVEPLDYAINASQFQPVSTATPTPTQTPDPNNPPLPTSQSLTAFDYSLPDLSWPAENTVVPADAAKLENSGITAAILSSTNVKESSTVAVPGASAQAGDLAVEVSNATVSGYLRAAAAATTRAAWAQAMAELTTSVAAIGMASDGDAPVILATFARGWQDSDAEFSETLTGLYTRSWVNPGTLTDVAGSASQTVTIASRPQPASRVSVVRQMLDAEAHEVRFAIVTSPDQETLTSSRRLILLSLMSDEWLSDPSGWRTATTKFLKQSHQIITSVQVVHSSRVTLLGDQVSLPITVSNTLNQTVTVFLAVRPQTTQIAVGKNQRLVSVTINADSQRQVRVPIQSLSNGKVFVDVSLYSASGRKIGTTKTIRVDVQAGWETLGTLIFGALVVGVFAFGLVRNIRKRRKAAGEPDEDESADPAEGGSAAADSTDADHSEAAPHE